MLNIEGNPLEGLSFIDLFAGIGGFRLALESFGAKCVFSSEWDTYARQTYEANFSHTPSGDITQIPESTIPEHDILCAGFPCQAFSISGKQLGFKDSRGTLFFDVARILKEKHPKVVIMENVKNFYNHDEGRTMKVVSATMEELGYDFFHKVLSSSDYGIPQKRQRLYMVAFRKDLGVANFQFPPPAVLGEHLESILLQDESLLEDLYVSTENMSIRADDATQRTNTTIRVGEINLGRQGERIYSPQGVAITLSSNGGGIFAKTGGYLVNGRVRRLHPRECARLMGFPDDFILPPQKNRAYSLLGNSVVVDVLQYILYEIRKALQT